jgi:hypothetical protein
VVYSPLYLHVLQGVKGDSEEVGCAAHAVAVAISHLAFETVPSALAAMRTCRCNQDGRLCRISPAKKEEEEMLKMMHAYRKGKPRFNRSLVMVGIGLLDCALLFIVIAAFGMLSQLLLRLV